MRKSLHGVPSISFLAILGVFISLISSTSSKDIDLAQKYEDFKTSLIVLNHAETIQSHRKNLKYLEKYMFPLQKTMKFPNGVRATCSFGLKPTNVAILL